MKEASTLIETTPEYREISAVLNRWQFESLKSERFEYQDVATLQLSKARLTGQAVNIVTPICGNYETFRISGKRCPTIHTDLVWSDKGLRRGYVLLHEEIPHRLTELCRLGIPIHYALVLIDLGVSDQLLSDQNPDPAMAKLNSLQARRQYLQEMLNLNVSTMRSLLTHGLEQHGNSGSTLLDVSVEKLTNLVGRMRVNGNQNLLEYWNGWNHRLRGTLIDPESHWGGLMRRAIDKDGRYLKDAWGMTDKLQVVTRVVDENFGLTSAIGDNLHEMMNALFATDLQDKGEVVMLDSIPGPQNPGHKEFYAYNLDHPEEGIHRPKTPILRPFHNLVLLSDFAREVPYLGKSSDVMMREANTFGF
ncbi:MAG: hypothetical protein A3A65_00065 [Candidatus Chisholmbacteria bacterium RIFCSPLOWO2_01_FULL_49_14]|uniref:Uncharacterized protein n=1 Tax=Candidatus Chisholmbacteria bacterium RIFCSPLOWO2_01_FULL_49_14 TaxID=1797593 RepID=A0A1G1W1G0_9BACT|nr:MAG: hypothetical protein A3A65_00065 [Candidatus Chisholmbacteria bacterium RIFCSPLOWO2_01_FULL_49_14]